MSLGKISMIIFSTKKEMLGMAVLVILAVFGLGELVASTYSLHPELSGRKDFTMEYLMGKALLNGVDPYLPLSELRELYPISGDPKMHQPTHPPAMALMGLPLALFHYVFAAGIWFMIELLLIACSCNLLIKLWSVQNVSSVSILVFLTLFAWEPISNEIISGQLNSLLLLLLICAWIQFSIGKDVSGGVFLGLAIAIKLLSWPLALLLLVRRNWRGFLATLAATIVVNLVAIGLMGPAPFWRYYTTTSSILMSGWSSDPANFSTWSLGWRLFEGTSISEIASRGFVVNLISPIYQSSTLASATSSAIPILFFLCSLILAARMKSFDFAFGLMVCASILFSPIAWSHYLVMALLPVAIVLRSLTQSAKPGGDYWIIHFFALTTGILLVAPESVTGELMCLFETQRMTGPTGIITHHIPFAAGLFTLVPMAALLGLMWLLWMLDKEKFFIETTNRYRCIEE